MEPPPPESTDSAWTQQHEQQQQQQQEPAPGSPPAPTAVPTAAADAPAGSAAPSPAAGSPASLLHMSDDSDAAGPSGTPRLTATQFYTPPTAAAAAASAAATAAALAASSRSRPGPGSKLGRRPAATLHGGASSSGSPATLRSGSVLVVEDVGRVAGALVAHEAYSPAGAAAAKDTFWPCTFNLSKVIMGAGMMAIPRAFMLLGLLPGLAVMVLVAGLTFFTLASLVSASSTTAGRGSAGSGRGGGSYGALVRRTVGPGAETSLQVAVLATCYVMNIVFVVVLGDLLLGDAPDYRGLLPECLGRSPADTWWLGRPVVLGVLSAVLLLPLSAMRHMERLAVVNIAGVAANGGFAALMLWLAAAAAAGGAAFPPRLLPDTSDLGGSPLLVAVSLASVVPVLLNCDVCHQSLHPLMPLLAPYSVPRMQRVVAAALAICNGLYLAVTLSAGLVFGPGLQADVLANVNAAALAPLIGEPAAASAALLVRLGYLLSLVGSYVLLCWPLRQCVGDLLLPRGQADVQAHWLGLTSLLVVSVYGIAFYLPSIWGALALVGATASTVQAFIVPGLVVLSVERRWHGGGRSGGGAAAPLLAPTAEEEGQAAGGGSGSCGSRLRQAAAVGVILLGVALFANGLLDAGLDYWQASSAQEGADGSNVLLAGRLLATWRRLLRPPF